MIKCCPSLQELRADPFFLGNIGKNALNIRHKALASKNCIEARTSVERVFVPHQLTLNDRAQRINFVHSFAMLGKLSFNQISYGADVEVAIDEPERNRYVFVVPLGGVASVEFNRRTWDLNPGSCVMVDPHSNYRFAMAHNHSHLAIGIPQKFFENAKCSFDAVRGIDAVINDQADADTDGLFLFLDYICSEFGRKNSIIALPKVANSFQASFIAMLRDGLFPNGNSVVDSDALPDYVQRAERFVAEHLEDDICLDDIVRAAQVPARTLYHGFKHYVGMSPMRWVKSCRLERARAALLADRDGDVSVIEIANRYWITHAGRFARAYCEMFGETPSTTIKRIHDSRTKSPDS